MRNSFYDERDSSVNEKWLGAAPNPRYSSLIPPEEPSLQAEIHSLLQQLEQSSETVRDLASNCLKQFKTACGVVLEWQKDVGRERVRNGDDPEAVRRETEEKIDAARKLLKRKLEGLLQAAEQFKL